MLPAALLIALLAVGLVPASGTAWASDGLTSANPADGAALAVAPGAVVLTFSGPPDPYLSHVSTRNGSGDEMDRGELTRSGASTLSQPVTIRSTGDFTIAYHVVFDDGTSQIGVLRFSVGTGAPPAALGGGAIQRARQEVASLHSQHDEASFTPYLLLGDAALVAVIVLWALRLSGPRRSLAVLREPRQTDPAQHAIPRQGR